MGFIGRRECAPPSDSKIPNEKARRRFPGAGSIVAMQISCDDGHRQMICPTCQIFF
jgi:hypothetical protein